RSFEILACDFPARDHVGGCILYGFVVRSDEGFGPFLLATIENDRYEALGFNFRRSGKRKIRFHVMQNSIVGRCANAQAQCRTREPQRSAFWSTERLPALFAGLVMVTVFVAVVSCSRKNSEPAAIASIAPAAPMATPAPATAAIAPIPTAPKKVKKHRPTTATYVNSEYGVSITYPRKYGLKLGDEAQLSWPGLGPVPTDFVKPGGVMLAAVELPAS